MTFLVVGLFILSAKFAAARTTQETQRPNIIFILADDLSWGDLGCYGQKKILTPNIDRIAAEGIRFTQAYAGNSVCAPSRSCLMQGLHPGHATVRGNSYRNYRHSLRPEDVTVAQVLKRVGYATGLFGKWGLALSDQPGIPNNKGFDKFFGYLNQRKAHSFYPEFLWRNRERTYFPENAGHHHREQSSYDAQGKCIPIGIEDPSKATYSFDLYCSESLEFVRRHKDQPFFLYLAYTPPHGPLIAPHLGPYTDKDWAIGHKEWAAMITNLDSQVGRLLGLIDTLKLEERTIIFFASDNGFSAGGYNRDKAVPTIEEFFGNRPPTRGRKGDTYDAAFRVPAMARWPGKILPGRVSDHIWAFWDFLPTATELADAQILVKTDGISIVPTLLGHPDQQRQHEYLYWEFGQNQAVRMGRWYAHRKSGLLLELYDLDRDPMQSDDLAASHPDLVRKIERIMKESHSPSDVWPSPGESTRDFEARLERMGVPPRPKNIDG